MNEKFSYYLESKYDDAKKIIEKLSKNFEYVSILGVDSDGQNIKVSEKSITVKDIEWKERGFVIRVFNGGLFSEYSFDDISNVNVICNQVIKELNVTENIKKAIYVQKSENILYEEEKITKEFSRMDDYVDISLEDIIKKCKSEIMKSMNENEYIISASIRLETLKISKMFISTNKDLKQVYSWADGSFNCILNRNDNTKFNYCGVSDISINNVLKKLNKQISQTCSDGLAVLDSEHIVPGEYDCITTPEITGLIAHEAFGHGVEMDMFVKGRALGQQYVGKQVGSELVEMHEGAIPFVDVSSYFFDDEGTLAHDTIEIKDGILISGIADAIAAGQLGIKPTGNGKRESYKRKAYTRMTSTYFSPRKSNLEDMINSIEYGFLIDRVMGGMEDPKNWGIQCIALIGKEIKNGKLTGRIFSPIIMTGYVPDLLKSISMVSNDFELYGSGACGKGYKEWVKTSLGGPYLKAKVKLG